jgi:hypothetical protein
MARRCRLRQRDVETKWRGLNGRAGLQKLAEPMNERLGKRKRYKMRFLAEHPLCCFCGGKAVAAEIDHQPARALFDGHDGPEGFEFPACEDCNRGSSQYENALALIVRLATKQTDSEIRQSDFRKYVEAMGNNFPRLIRPMTSIQKRAFLRENRIERPSNSILSDLKMVEAGDHLASAAIDGVLKKLFLALHYKHAGTIAPEDAEVSLLWVTNALARDPPGLTDFVKALNQRAVVKRGRRDLSDQFNYRFGVDMAENFSAYSVVFRDSLGAVGTVSPRKAQAHGG